MAAVHLFRARTPHGEQLSCSICNVTVLVRDPSSARAFAAQHAHPARPVDARYYGAGDLVARAAGALGIRQCAPCQQRQRTLNQWFPRVLRR